MGEGGVFPFESGDVELRDRMGRARVPVLKLQREGKAEVSKLGKSR